MPLPQDAFLRSQELASSPRTPTPRACWPLSRSPSAAVPSWAILEGRWVSISGPTVGGIPQTPCSNYFSL